MKQINKIITILAISLLSTGCVSTEYAMKTNKELTPAADAKLFVTKGENKGNLKIKLAFDHLAKPNEVKDGTISYIVWMAADKNYEQARNIGALSVSKELRGSLETTVPHKKFKVFVTPEYNASSRTPQGPVIFSTYVNEENS